MRDKSTRYFHVQVFNIITLKIIIKTPKLIIEYLKKFKNPNCNLAVVDSTLVTNKKIIIIKTDREQNCLRIM